MENSLEKLDRLLKAGYRITGFQYSWAEDDAHYAMIYLFNKKDELEQIEEKGIEGFRLIAYANETLEKIKKHAM